MFRTISVISRLCRMSLTVHPRLLSSPLVINNNVRFKYQNRGGQGGRRQTPTYENGEDDVDDSGDSRDYDKADHNMLEDK